jgi:predicted short-subunit dehydrogenase-like oxidoreductase (DUF2520 family)
MGQGLALALSGHDVSLVARTLHPVTAPLVLYPGSRDDAVRRADIVLLAVPDDAIAPLAGELADEGSIASQHVVLHLSGLLDREALAPLRNSGAALGSFHPLQTIADPVTAAQRLAGAYAGIEGDDRAAAAGEGLAAALGMRAVRVPAMGKPAYHAGAVFAANFTTVLAAVAERLARSAGIAPEVASRLYLPLFRGAVANLEGGAAAALTGPVRRGDVRTIAAHLAVLGPEEGRLYRLLAGEALALARTAGLPPEAAARVAEALREPT